VRTELNVADGFAGALSASRLDRFERVMALEAPSSAVTRRVPGRFTTRVELSPAASGAPALVVYLKRYRGRLRAGAARHEWRRLYQLRAAGIPCPEPVAFGESRGLFGRRQSFLMTAEIPGATQADWWIEERPGRRRELVAAVADLAHRFHRAGFHHRDFYLCHFFVREAAKTEAAGAGLDLFLIDLQRCGRLEGRRWLVKDLAQLHFSMGLAGFSAEDWREFLDRYGGVDPALAQAILAKSLRIARHVPRYG